MKHSGGNLEDRMEEEKNVNCQDPAYEVLEGNKCSWELD